MKNVYHCSHAMFDTYKYVKSLIKNGLSEKQAESIVQIISDSRDTDLSRLATKDQVGHLQERMERFELATKDQICHLQERMERFELATKDQVGHLQERMERFENRFERIDIKFDRLENEMKITHRWMIGLILAILTLVTTILFK